jgi:hypothetical protein
MADALNSNFSKIDKNSINISKCNSHAFRKFKENTEVFEELKPIVEKYSNIFKNEEYCRSKCLNWKDRLELHKKKSLPIMESIKKYIKEEFENKNVEPNSPLAKNVFNYFLNHYNELTSFCKVPGAPVDNNECERMIKYIVRHRKNSLFFKNKIGANVGDILASILVTAKINNLNTQYYLEMLMTHKKRWKSDFEAFLPWNFEETMKKIHEEKNSDPPSTS